MNSSRGIPTVYEGVEFRSRAEARWAAFFDIVQWPWVYEPFDEDGYIPDFVLRFKQEPVLVEVKGGCITYDELIREAEKLRRAAYRRRSKHCLLLGAALMGPSELGPMSIGILGQKLEEMRDYEWANALVSGACGDQGFSIYHGVCAFDCVLCGRSEGGYGPHGGRDRKYQQTIGRFVQYAWLVASNQTKWRR